jgi:hypothetical protein
MIHFETFFKINKHSIGVFVYLFLVMSNCQSIQGQTLSIKETVNIHDFYGQLYIQEIPIEVLGLPDIMNEKFGFESIQISIEQRVGFLTEMEAIKVLIIIILFFLNMEKTD